MIVELPWGKGSLKINLPESWQVHLPERFHGSAATAPDEKGIITAALGAPAGAERLSLRNLSGRKILIIIDDNTRPTPADRFFHLILEELAAAGADPENIHAMTALGIHTAMTETEMAAKIGPDNLRKISWSNHDAFDSAAHHRLGETRRGTPVILNKKVAESDLVILIGMIEPHLWAGFGGGMKNLFPGVAAVEAIGHHHGMIAEPPYRFNRVGVMPGENPFRRDLEEMRKLIPAEIFILNVLLDKKQRIAAAFSGDPIAAHRQGIDYCHKTSGISLDHPMDAVIVNSCPMDHNFKQSMKCVGNALPALKPGGLVMAFLRADRGLDDIPLPDKPPPLPLLRFLLRSMGKSRVMKFLELVKKGLNVEEKFLAYYSMRLIGEYTLFCHVPVLTPDEVRHLGFFNSFANPAAMIEKGRRKLGKNAHVAVFPDGGATFPVIREDFSNRP